MQFRQIEYTIRNKTHIANLFQTASGALKVPTLIVFPDFMGNTERAFDLAKKWCLSLNVNVILADGYGENFAAKTREDAMDMMNLVVNDLDYYNEICLAKVEQVKHFTNADRNKIFALGYCLGGQSVLNLAKLSSEICGAISIHGILRPMVQFQHSHKPKILVLHGAQDSGVSEENIRLFNNEMIAHGIDATFISFMTSVHAFTNYAAVGDHANERLRYDFLSDKRSNKYVEQFIFE